MTPLRIGTRGSALALYQARRVQRELGVDAEIVVLRTAGDRHQDVPLAEQGGVGFFTKEIEEALHEGRVDLAVHSLKDLPVVLPPGGVLAAILARGAPGDVLLVRPEAHDPAAPFPVRAGATVGTGAVRRRALLAAVRPDLVPVPMRGNVPTRVEKALRGDCDALIMARAGLERLAHDVSPLVACDLAPTAWPGAPGQACIAVEVRADDDRARALAARLDHAPSRAAVEAERALLLASGGGCHSAFAAYADGDAIHAFLPDAAGVGRLARFAGPDAMARATAWVRAGAPAGGPPPVEGLCRPASPWC